MRARLQSDAPTMTIRELTSALDDRHLLLGLMYREKSAASCSVPPWCRPRTCWNALRNSGA